MNRRVSATDENQRRPVVLVLYSEVAQAAALMQRVPGERYEVFSCPLTVSLGRWSGELEPDVILLAPPSNPGQLTSTCEKLRAQAEQPIVVVSEASDLLVAEALATGVDEFIVLPVGDRQLVARIDAVIRRSSRFRKETTQVGGLTLSNSGLYAELHGRRCSLSPIEFRLLSCLVSAPGKVLTHQTLMARVWGAEYVASRHYLHIYVRYLREKLEDDPSNPRIILNAWGVGYRFQPPPLERASSSNPD